MKTLIALALFASATSAHAVYLGPDQEYDILRCHAVPRIADNDLYVSLRQGGKTGRTFARVTRSLITGAHVVADLVVESRGPRCGNDPTMRYVGQDFDLTIQQDARSERMPAHLSADLDGRRYDQELACEFVMHLM